MVSLKKSPGRLGRARYVAAVLGMVALAGPAWASRPNEAVLDATALTQLEQRAASADPREQCFLYTEILHALIENAGREMAAGQDDELTATLRQIDGVMARVEKASARDARRLKNAEQLIEHTQQRLSDMTRVATSEEHAAMQAALAHMDHLHSTLLTLVFSR